MNYLAAREQTRIGYRWSVLAPRCVVHGRWALGLAVVEGVGAAESGARWVPDWSVSETLSLRIMYIKGQITRRINAF